MAADAPDLRRAARANWLAIGATAAIVVAGGWLTETHVDWRSFALPALLATASLVIARFYDSRRREAGIAAIFGTTAQLVCFTAVGAPLSYLAARAGYPLWDATLAAWDQQIGFDWPAALKTISAHPQLETVLGLAYGSLLPQMIFTTLALGFTGRIARLQTFLSAFIACTLTTIVMSAFLPATGPWLFLGLDPSAAHGFLPTSSTSWPVFLGLRDGSLHTLHALGSEGIITFPSLHAALAVIFALALWQVPILRWIVLGLNITMLLATPLYGSHYLVDVLAGIAIAVVCWSLTAWAMSKGPTTVGTSPLPSISDAPALIPDPAPDSLASPDVDPIRRKVGTA